MKENPHRLVLFLGAGFSPHPREHWGYCPPVMKDFGKNSSQSLKQVREEYVNPSSNNRKLIGPLLQKSGETYEAFRKWCRQCDDSASIEDGNLEHIMALVEILHQVGVTEIELNDNSISLTRLRKELGFWLWNIYKDGHPFYESSDNRGPDCPASARVVRLLKQNDLLQDLTIITTNYDIIFESLCWRENAPCRYPAGISPDRQNVPVKRGQHTSEDYSFQRMTTDDNSAPLVCKLHGSINYFADEYATDSVLLYDQIVQGGDQIGQSYIGKNHKYGDRPALFLVDAIYYIHLKRQVPLIIPPTYAKLHELPWLEAIWHEASTALTQAQRIIFIGGFNAEAQHRVRL